MDEARRFLRYLIPGTLFFVQTALVLFAILPKWTIESVQTATGKGTFDGGKALGLALGFLATSGTLGFLLSMVHHSLYWHYPIWYKAVDHRGFLKSLKKAGLISDELPEIDMEMMVSVRVRFAHILFPESWTEQIRQIVKKLFEARDKWASKRTLPGRLLKYSKDSVDRKHNRVHVMNAWVIVTKLWHERIKDSASAKIGSANDRAKTMADLVHSIGACRVSLWAGTVTAVVMALNQMYVAGRNNFHLAGVAEHRIIAWFALFLASTLVVLSHISYRQTNASATHFVTRVLRSALEDEKERADEQTKKT